MKTAALLKKNKEIYFKVNIAEEKDIRKKLRMVPGVQKTGFTTFKLPFNEDTISFLEDNEFEFNGAFKRFKQIQWEKRNPIQKIPKYKKKGLVPYKYQIEGVNFIDYLDGLALVADVMGLGKTVQALSWIQLNRKIIHKILIIAPSSLKINWYEEFEKWVTKKYSIEILEGQTPYQFNSDVVIVNYDILHYWVVDLKLTNFDVCIADELHYVKSDKSLRAKAYDEITKSIPRRIGLTGTPIESDPVEIFYMAKRINKNIFPNYKKFIERYCGAKQVDQKIRGGKLVKIKRPDGSTSKVWKQNTRKVWKRNGVTNEKELHRILRKHLMIRRTHKDVDLQLPDRVESNIHLEIENRPLYQKAEDDFIVYIKEKFKKAKELDKLDEIDTDIDESKLEEKLDAISNAPAFVKLNELKMLAAKGKVNLVVEWLKNFLDSTDEKIIVFAINKFMVKILSNKFPDAVKIVGGISGTKRDEAVKAFQNNANIRMIIVSEAGGIGLTLTAASKIAILQYPWNPGKLSQVEYRSIRIGQKAKKVTVYRFIAKNTIEDRIINLLNYKQDEIDKIIDGKTPTVKRKLLKLLVKSYQEDGA